MDNFRGGDDIGDTSDRLTGKLKKESENVDEIEQLSVAAIICAKAT